MGHMHAVTEAFSLSTGFTSLRVCHLCSAEDLFRYVLSGVVASVRFRRNGGGWIAMLHGVMVKAQVHTSQRGTFSTRSQEWAIHAGSNQTWSTLSTSGVGLTCALQQWSGCASLVFLAMLGHWMNGYAMLIVLIASSAMIRAATLLVMNGHARSSEWERRSAIHDACMGCILCCLPQAERFPNEHRWKGPRHGISVPLASVWLRAARSLTALATLIVRLSEPFARRAVQDCAHEPLRTMVYTVSQGNAFFDVLNGHGVYLPASKAIEAMQLLHDVCALVLHLMAISFRG